MANAYDAIVIGGGHNGLTAGAYFARAGARTVVLEARSKTGGAADTSAPFADHPEINVTTYSYVMSLMPPTIIKELNLKRHGYDVTAFGPYYQAYPDGRSIKVYADDAARSHDSIAQFSKKDAEALPQWEAWLQEVAVQPWAQLVVLLQFETGGQPRCKTPLGHSRRRLCGPATFRCRSRAAGRRSGHRWPRTRRYSPAAAAQANSASLAMCQSGSAVIRSLPCGSITDSRWS